VHSFFENYFPPEIFLGENNSDKGAPFPLDPPPPGDFKGRGHKQVCACCEDDL